MINFKGWVIGSLVSLPVSLTVILILYLTLDVLNPVVSLLTGAACGFVGGTIGINYRGIEQ